MGFGGGGVGNTTVWGSGTSPPVTVAPPLCVNADTLRGWCKQAAIDAGERPGTTTSDANRIKQLEAEVRELKRANVIFSRMILQGS